MAHAQKPDFVFRRNGRVHLNRRGRQFSRLLTAELCASDLVMLDKPRFEGVSPSLPLPCVTVCQEVSNALYPLYRRLGGPQGRSGQVWKISPPPGFGSQTVQPVGNRYTDWDTRLIYTLIPHRTAEINCNIKLSVNCLESVVCFVWVAVAAANQNCGSNCCPNPQFSVVLWRISY